MCQTNIYLCGVTLTQDFYLSISIWKAASQFHSIFSYLGLKKKKKNHCVNRKVVKISVCQCVCFYSAFEVSPHSLRLCLQREKKKDQVKPQGGNILSNIYLCLRHRITFLILLSRERPSRGSGQSFHHLFSFPKSACIINTTQLLSGCGGGVLKSDRSPLGHFTQRINIASRQRSASVVGMCSGFTVLSAAHHSKVIS